MNLPGLRVARVTPAAAFFAAAEAFLQGIDALLRAEGVSAIPLALLAGQALEGFLKAFLASAGFSEEQLRRAPFGHDLSHLWTVAASTGLPIDSTPPDWVKQFSGLHDYPFFLRYPMGLNGLVLPNAGRLASELAKLETIVRQAIAKA